ELTRRLVQPDEGALHPAPGPDLQEDIAGGARPRGDDRLGVDDLVDALVADAERSPHLADRAPARDEPPDPVLVVRAGAGQLMLRVEHPVAGAEGLLEKRRVEGHDAYGTGLR